VLTVLVEMKSLSRSPGCWLLGLDDQEDNRWLLFVNQNSQNWAVKLGSGLFVCLFNDVFSVNEDYIVE